MLVCLCVRPSYTRRVGGLLNRRTSQATRQHRITYEGFVPTLVTLYKPSSNGGDSSLENNTFGENALDELNIVCD